MDLGQIGILLIGIGVLFFSVYLGMIFKETSEVIRDTKILLQRNSREIEDIIRDTSKIISSVSEVSNVVSGKGGASLMGIATKTAMSVAKMRKQRNNK